MNDDLIKTYYPAYGNTLQVPYWSRVDELYSNVLAALGKLGAQGLFGTSERLGDWVDVKDESGRTIIVNATLCRDDVEIVFERNAQSLRDKELNQVSRDKNSLNEFGLRREQANIGGDFFNYFTTSEFTSDEIIEAVQIAYHIYSKRGKEKWSAYVNSQGREVIVADTVNNSHYTSQAEIAKVLRVKNEVVFTHARNVPAYNTQDQWALVRNTVTVNGNYYEYWSTTEYSNDKIGRAATVIRSNDWVSIDTTTSRGPLGAMMLNTRYYNAEAAAEWLKVPYKGTIYEYAVKKYNSPTVLYTDAVNQNNPCREINLPTPISNKKRILI